MKAVDPTTAPHPRPASDARGLWAGVLGPPLLWLIHLLVNYIIVPLACRRDASVIVHGATLLAILGAAAMGLFALARWRRAGREWPDDSASVMSQDRFLAVSGMAMSAMIVAALIAQWLPTFFVDPCR